MRDITLEDTFYMDFTTRAFATGIPTTLAGSPVLSVLEENNATPITAGVSVSVDRASVTGLNMATIVATAANGYESGKGYSVYISTGTVGGVSVVGEVVGQFTIEASASAVDLANGTDGLGAIKGDTGEIGTAGAGLTNINLPNQTMDIVGNITGSLSGSVGSVTGPVGSVTGAVGSVTSGVTVTTNNDKTGYSLTQTFPTNFADLSISVTTGLVDITQAAADKAWGTAARTVTAATNITSDGAAINATAGVVDTVNLTNTLTTYTGNTPQTADHTAAIADIPTVAEFNARTLVSASYALEATVGALNNISAADVNAQMLDVLNVDTFAELSSVPAATSTLVDKISWIFALHRNKITQTATLQSVRNDADSGNIATSVTSGDGTTTTKGEYS